MKGEGVVREQGVGACIDGLLSVDSPVGIVLAPLHREKGLGQAGEVVQGSNDGTESKEEEKTNQHREVNCVCSAAVVVHRLPVVFPADSEVSR
jgi:hypothetical protein